MIDPAGLAPRFAPTPGLVSPTPVPPALDPFPGGA